MLELNPYINSKLLPFSNYFPKLNGKHSKFRKEMQETG